MELLRGNADFGTHAELSPVSESRRSVHVHRRRIDAGRKAIRSVLVGCDDGLRMHGSVPVDVLDRLIDALDALNRDLRG